MKKFVSILIATLLVMALLAPAAISAPATVFAHTAGAPQEVDLLAGKNIKVGTVSVWNDADNLYVKYETIGGWEMTETHLAVAATGDGIPQTKTHNPIPGQFPYSTKHDPAVTEFTYTIPLTGLGTNPVIAAHAVVQKTTVNNPAPYYASTVVDYLQGKKKDGTPVRTERSTPAQGLVYEEAASESSFFSIGFGGWIIVSFDCPIRNGDGNDVKIIEDTWGGYPLEKAEIYASQDGVSWTLLGVADNTNYLGIHTISEFDLGALQWAKYIKVVDTTDPTPHGNEADGFDLNAVVSLQNCLKIEKETAWAEGTQFPGKNWATYFTYIIQ